MHYIVIGLITALFVAVCGQVFYVTRLNRFGSISVPISFFAVLWYVAFGTAYLLDASLKIKHLVGLTLAGVVVYAGAYFEHRRGRRGNLFFANVIIAAAVIVASGIGVRSITNPF